jgi:hypothetical protein
MKKMQQFSVLLLAVGLIFGLAGCPADDDGPGKDNRSGTLKIVNNSDDPIPKIEMRNQEYAEVHTQRNWSYTYSTVIAAGETKDIQLTWPDSLEHSDGFFISISTEFPLTLAGARLQDGKTTTVTIDEYGLYSTGEPQ